MACGCLAEPASTARDEGRCQPAHRGSACLPQGFSSAIPPLGSPHWRNADRVITDRVRSDLTGPDGQPGIDISGYTMKNMYEEMSKGAYTVSGEASPWVEVPHSEAWYGASRCFQNDDGVWTAGAIQSMNGHPDNPDGAGALGQDAVDALAAADPNFPWADYDIEDQGDIDGDGNVFEPDGIIDHLVLVHAGADKSGGGGDAGRVRHLGALLDDRRRVYRSRAPTSRSGTTSSSPRTPAWASSPMSTATISVCPTCTTRRQRRRVRTIDFWDLMSTRLAQRANLPVDPDSHGPLGQVGARLGRAADLRTGLQGAGRPARPDLAYPEGDQGRHQDRSAEQGHHARRSAQRRDACGTRGPIRTGPTSG